MSAELTPFFAVVGPFLLGQKSHGETVQRLYGEQATTTAAIDAKRLAIYGRFCRNHRHEALSLFSATQAVIVGALGQATWAELVERYFVAHPMHHFELNQNGEFFPQFLAQELAAATSSPLPPFIAELADFEWWEWLIGVAPDSADDSDDGPLRLASTVDLRPYSHDLVTWLDDDEATRSAAPEAQANIVVFWRDHSLRARREHAQPLELVLAKALLEGVAINAGLAAQVGVSWNDLEATLADLHAAGIICGQRSEPVAK